MHIFSIRVKICQCKHMLRYQKHLLSFHYDKFYDKNMQKKKQLKWWTGTTLKGNEDSRDNELNWMMRFTFMIPDLGLNIKVEQDTSRTWWRSFVEINLMENNRLCKEINLFMFSTFNLEPRNVYVFIASLLWLRDVYNFFHFIFLRSFSTLNKM